MRGRHKKWAVPFLEGHPDIVFEKIDPDDPFFSHSPLFLEIGTGKGDFILKMPSLRDGHYLGLERDVSIAAVAAKKAFEASTGKIRMAALDFDECYEDLSKLRFDGIFLNFSDPWPKKRHWKRRLTVSDRLSKMRTILKDDGAIYFKSDSHSLYDFTLEQAPLAGFFVVYKSEDYPGDPLDAITEYESNFRSQGKPITRIILKKGSPSR